MILNKIKEYKNINWNMKIAVINKKQKNQKNKQKEENNIMKINYKV